MDSRKPRARHQGEDHTEMGCLATAMHAVHAIPVVRAAPPPGVLDLAEVTSFNGEADMSEVSPARIGLLFDYFGDNGGYDENLIPSLQLVADEYLGRGVLERPVEFVVRMVQGLPKGSFRAVRDAFFELVE